MITDRSAQPTARRTKVQSVEVGLSLLVGLADLGGVASLSSLAAATGLAAPKVHRYLSSLVAGGFVARDEDTGGYRLGLTSLTIGLAALRANDPVRLLAAELSPLRDTVGATCFVAVPANAGPTVLLVAEAPGAVVVNVRLGSALPEETSATGLVLREVLDQLATSNGSAALLHSRSISVADTVLVGVSAVSAAVRDAAGYPVAAITALGPTGTIDVSEEGTTAQAVRAVAKRVSATLGFAETT